MRQELGVALLAACISHEQPQLPPTLSALACQLAVVIGCNLIPDLTPPLTSSLTAEPPTPSPAPGSDPVTLSLGLVTLPHTLSSAFATQWRLLSQLIGPVLQPAHQESLTQPHPALLDPTRLAQLVLIISACEPPAQVCFDSYIRKPVDTIIKPKPVSCSRCVKHF